MSEMKPEGLASLDQHGALLGDVLPKLWRRLYDGCKEEGFTDSETMDLLKAYIWAQFHQST